MNLDNNIGRVSMPKRKEYSAYKNLSSAIRVCLDLSGLKYICLSMVENNRYGLENFS